MTKAQEMLAKAGFPDTKQGRAAFHKMYPTPEDFFKVHGNVFKDFPDMFPIQLPIKPENVTLNHSPDREYYLENTPINSLETDDDSDMYKSGGGIHIKPSHKGRFTAYKKRTGKTTAEALHSKDPHVRQMANFARNAAKWKHEDGGVVDAYQLMGMPTPKMYGPGSTVHPTLTLSTEQNPNKASYLNSPYYKDIQSIDSRNTLAGTFPLNNSFNLTGSYSDANNGTYTAGAEYSLGNVLSGAGGKGPSRKYDNPDIAHKGSNSFLDTYGHLRAGVTNAGNKVLPYWGGDFTVAHQMGRVKGPNGLRQPKGTIYGNLEVNQVQNPANNLFVDNNYGRANIGGSYNFGKGLGVYGEAGYDINRNSPRAEIGLKKTFADGGHVTDYSPSSDFGTVRSMNNTYMHGYGNGGPVGMYGFGSTIKDLGYGMADMSLGTIGGLTGIQSMQDIVDEDQYSNDKFDDTANFGGKLGSAVVKNIPGVGQVVGAVGGGLGALANTTFKIDERNYDPSQHTSKWDKWGNIVEQAGNMASMFTNPASAASSLSKGAQTAMNIGKIAGLGATAVKAGQDIDKSRGGTYDPTNALNLGMGIAKSGFFGGNTNTSGNFGNNTKGAVDYTPTVDGPLYAAMGGAVNAPNMMKYDAGSSVSNTDNLSPKDQYNLFLKAKPVTKYFSNAQVPHPADGSMDPRGTVTGSVDPQTGEPIQINIEKNEANWKLPNSTNFITTKKDTEKILAFDKNNDGIAKASYMANIARAKAIKDAKAKSMMANGGMVGQYGYGGGIMKYDGGSDIPFATPSYLSAEADRYVGNGLNLQTQPFGFQRTKSPYMQNWNSIQPDNPTYNATWTNRGGSPPPIETDMQGSPSYQYENNSTGSEYGSSPTDISNYTPIVADDATGTSTPSWFARNKGDLKTAGGKALMYGPGIYNIMRSFGKPFQMNPADYQIKGTVDPYEEEYVPDYRPYNAAVANLNRMPGSANLAARTNLFNAMQQQQDDARYKISLGNAQRKMTADQAKLGVEGQNLNTAMQIAQLNEQNRAAKRNMLGQGFSDLSNIAQFERFNKMTGNALASIMQHYTVLPDGTMIPKTAGTYVPGATPTIGTTNSYDPSLVSPNRYMNQGIDFTYSKPSFRKR
jgi:hypothetical protein